MGFSRQEYWSGLPLPSLRARTTIFLYLIVQRELVAHVCLTLCDPMDCSLPGSSVHGILQATGVGSHSVLQEIFPTQGLNPGILYRRQIFFFFNHLSHQGSPFLDYIIQQFHFLVSEENQNTNLKRYFSMLIASLFAIGKTRNILSIHQ